MKGRRNKAPSPRLRSLLVLSGNFGADGLAGSLAFHNTVGAQLAGTYLVFTAIAGPVLVRRRKI